LAGNRWIYYHDEGEADDASDRSDVAEEIEVEPVKQRCIDRASPSDQKQRVTVRSSTRDCFGGEIAPSAGPVLNDKLLSKTFRQPLTNDTCNDVRCAACRKPDEDPNRS
jgi:hypothetical protein